MRNWNKAMRRINLIALIATIIFLQSCVSDGKDDWERLSKTHTFVKEVPFSCPSGSEDTIERWGLYGYSRYCLKGGKKHGKWMAFEDSTLVIEGEYIQGIKEGNWKWYNSDGTIFRIVEYKNGLETMDTKLNE